MKACQSRLKSLLRWRLGTEFQQKIIVGNHMLGAGFGVAGKHSVGRVNVRQPFRRPVAASEGGLLDRLLAAVSKQRQYGHGIPGLLTWWYLSDCFGCRFVGFSWAAEIPVAKGQGRVRAPVDEPAFNCASSCCFCVFETQRVQAPGLPTTVPGRPYCRGIQRHGQQGLGQIQLRCGIIRLGAGNNRCVGDPGLHCPTAFFRGRPGSFGRHLPQGFVPTGAVEIGRGTAQAPMDHSQGLAARVLCSQSLEGQQQALALYRGHGHSQGQGDQVDGCGVFADREGLARQGGEFRVQTKQCQTQHLQGSLGAQDLGLEQKILANLLVPCGVTRFDKSPIGLVLAGQSFL